MATSRKVSVSLTVGAASPVDITDYLASFSFEESVAGVGETLDIVVDNTSGFFTGMWWIEKGTPITATITTTDWNNPGDRATRATGMCWCDTVEWEVKPSEVTIKATAVSPDLLNDQVNHQGYEGQSQQTIFGIQAEQLGTKLLSGTSSTSDSTNDGSSTTADMRTDQDNQGNLSFLQAQAHKIGSEIVVKSGKIYQYDQKTIESKQAYRTLTLGSSEIIKGKFTTNCIKKVAGVQNSHLNTNTGQTTTGTFTPTTPPTGTKSILKNRLRPLVPGNAGDQYPAVADAVDENQQGDPFEGEPYQS
jgi:uncharacterized protein